jgi:Helix-turn-helix domain
MEHIAKHVEVIERNIKLKGADPITQHGFTQMPNVVLRNPNISVGAKVVYTMFLSYAWGDSQCFPGQDRLAQDIGMTRVRVTQLIGELEAAGLIEITRRGQGKTNTYELDIRVEPKKPTSRSK